MNQLIVEHLVTAGDGVQLARLIDPMEPQRITPEEVKARLDSGEAVVFLDTRADDAWRRADAQIPHSVRVPPDEAAARLNDIPRRGLIVPYCT
jgi:rhodanese-related sulfurtransferase